MLRGIIPARAGFTLRRHKVEQKGRDHPPSRGVYEIAARVQLEDMGSSPLARGLHCQQLNRLRPQGIIPARAGFTGYDGDCSAGATDHPRSRGVYLKRSLQFNANEGSSPLARGLRSATRWRRRFTGIIPARAGFTDDTAPITLVSTDHPRSRGVYVTPRVMAYRCTGSSPLARGLRFVVCGGRERCGIIPARAGFTCLGVHRFPRSWDHPRSRGVYRLRGENWAQLPGSSPLARGLPGSVHREYPESGIIPARAGFTINRGSMPLGSPDHPRSRGVYSCETTPQILTCGSSPLARGLLIVTDFVDSEQWIIPARAGFTGYASGGHFRGPDHPRSRGVYAVTRVKDADGRGSSPLARGLRHHAVQPSTGPRIIPARAGFTQLGCRPPWGTWDHPRSRGVYPPRRSHEAR